MLKKTLVIMFLTFKKHFFMTLITRNYENIFRNIFFSNKCNIYLNNLTKELRPLKPGPARRVDQGPGDPRLEPGRVEEKTGKEKIRCDLADPAG
jgi:hypothetical protein